MGEQEDVFGVVDAQIGREYGVWSTEYRERDRHTKRDLTTPGPTRAGTRPLAVPRYGTIRPTLTTTQEYYLLLFIHHGPIAQLTLHWPCPLFFWGSSFLLSIHLLQVEVAPRWLNRVKASEPTFFFTFTRYLWRWYGLCYVLLYIRVYGLAVGTAVGTAVGPTGN